ncbi:MAG: hypothetical protein AB7D38_12110 [Sulfurimonas sp.]|uniref:hypothetical protein n=1 Tax=Sulfurimonas sp. TaxID=2022749 RepID=UPI003D106889
MQDFDVTTDFTDIAIGDYGQLLPEKNPNLAALIDADTIAFNACLAVETEEVVTADMIDIDTVTIDGEQKLLTIELWNELTGYDTTIDTVSVYSSLGVDAAVSEAVNKINRIIDLTGCGAGAELHFSVGRIHFRYMLTPDYKSKRKTTRYPLYLTEVKEALTKLYEGSFCHSAWEADDAVVFKKRFWPSKYILCALDKDVYNSLEGTHFNYFESQKFNKQMGFITTTKEQAAIWPYMQAICGDTSDSIQGCPGIGPKKALKFINESMNELELWEGTLRAYRSVGLTAYDAIQAIRLVKMTQLWPMETNAEISKDFFNAQLKLWSPSEVGDHYDYE